MHSRVPVGVMELLRYGESVAKDSVLSAVLDDEDAGVAADDDHDDMMIEIIIVIMKTI